MITTTTTATLADVLAELHHPGEHVSVCTALPGGIFRPVVMAVADVPAELPQDRNVWFGINPVAPTMTGRGTAEDVTRWAALWADLDVKAGSLPTLEAAQAVVDTLATMLNTPPAFVTHSGHGLQPLWPLEHDDPAADTTDPDTRARAQALLRRWGRLVARVAADHGATDVDSVFDLPRVLRAPGTVNVKDPARTVPATATTHGGHALSVAEVAEVLDAYGVAELPEDTQTLGTVVAPPAAWTFGESTCGYVAAKVRGWATDAPTARHPWLVSQAVKLAAAHRLGCITAADHAAAWQALAARFRHLLTTGQARREHPREVQDAAAWGVTAAACMTEDRARAELGNHKHRGDDLAGLVDLSQAPPVLAPVSAAGDASPAPEDAEDTTPAPGASWRPVDLADTVAGLLAGTIKRHAPTIGTREDGAALFYAGKVNGVAGASGSGKTWTALHACVQQLEAGHHAVYVDLEDDAAGVVGRLLDLGTDPEHVLARFHYVHPDESFGTFAAAELAAIITTHQPALVVIDSTGESMALDGAKPNDDDDTARWFRRLPTAIANAGPAVVVLDHVVKADEGGLWPIGSQRKRAAISGAQYMQTTVRPFAKDAAGLAKLVCAKDRHGNYRPGQKVAELAVTPGPDGVHLALRAPGEASEAGPVTFRPTALMERVSRALETAGEPLSFRDVDGRVTGKQQHVTTALEVLVAEGYVNRADGPRRSKLHSIVRPYRQADDPESDAYVSASATVSPSLEGEGGDRHSTPSGRQSGDSRDTHVNPNDSNDSDGLHTGRQSRGVGATVSPVYPSPSAAVMPPAADPCRECGDDLNGPGLMRKCVSLHRQAATA
ncbi:AAA family ATPase [Georgenia sp. AZ-5]|uniref:AAA family ATPase n=1 Tax=Georgenia sp. AZ-5 TaxID=3367526 RepID=UPI003754BA40